MAQKAMTSDKDSKNPPALDIQPRTERKYTLTKLGYEACRYFDRQDAIHEKPGEFINQALAKRGIDTSWMDE